MEENISQLDIERHMHDQATRHEMLGSGQKRFADFQKLIQRLHTLSEKDFEIAYTTFSSLLETLNSKKASVNAQDKDGKNKLSTFIGSGK